MAADVRNRDGAIPAYETDLSGIFDDILSGHFPGKFNWIFRNMQTLTLIFDCSLNTKRFQDRRWSGDAGPSRNRTDGPDACDRTPNVNTSSNTCRDGRLHGATRGGAKE